MLQTPDYFENLSFSFRVAFQCKRTKTETFEMMAWLPTFALCILDDCVNDNIMLIVVPAWMVMWHVDGERFWNAVKMPV